MPHYENVPFEVPDNWVWMTLGEVGTWQSGGTPSRSNKTYYGGNIPWLKTGDLNDGLISDIPESITEEAVANSSAKINPAGSVLIAMYGATIGKLGILTFPATTNQACCACIEFNAITQLYLFYFLLSQRNGFIAKGGGGAQPNISKEIIVNTFIPLPPLSEQQRIVMEIEKWFALIDQVEQGKADLQNTIKQTKSKILDLAIHGKLVPQDPNDEPAIKLLKRINPDFTPCDNGHSRKLPQGWYSVTANDVCSIIGGVSYNKADIQDTGIRVLRGGNIQNGKVIDCFDDVFISLSYQNNDNQVQRGDIIVVASTGSQTLIGKTGFADRDIPKTQIGAFLRIVRPKQKTLSPYIRLIFQTDAYKDYIRNVAKGSNINNVKNAHLQNFQICLPPLEEQQRIVQKIEELFSSLDDILTALEV
ncbi:MULTISPECIES: restriction endonuclease subunit S [Bacteroides]|uniref:Restriction endonuclease subunit S n=2 Tax=Bacteroides thetaiotaomicron TaxID=818 RepID=A0A414HP10_BACT4|nr:restriction endonuclease subunit S [Bacteroides thetaiotaomicron]KAB4268179.1 restriction endonuclease subunit S [Bacteroides thetaiotaomicron]KAB4351749.1 restriction endonuclease subunit S [Bacteroides thetaiotaomicron]KAB4375119.1 restriction endonuclease subunit S [Bacteroides thetaiotaomicron]MBV4091003.1 restriction endonuclease subunit S [Bacteroides thetaiotaomicron]MBV4138693.1 restriction endonuclease subunit S [Bacteroides thetaiotaomicron]